MTHRQTVITLCHSFSVWQKRQPCFQRWRLLCWANTLWNSSCSHVRDWLCCSSPAAESCCCCCSVVWEKPVGCHWPIYCLSLTYEHRRGKESGLLRFLTSALLIPFLFSFSAFSFSYFFALLLLFFSFFFKNNFERIYFVVFPEMLWVSKRKVENDSEVEEYEWWPEDREDREENSSHSQPGPIRSLVQPHTGMFCQLLINRCFGRFYLLFSPRPSHYTPVWCVFFFHSRLWCNWTTKECFLFFIRRHACVQWSPRRKRWPVFPIHHRLRHWNIMPDAKTLAHLPHFGRETVPCRSVVGRTLS